MTNEDFLKKFKNAMSMDLQYFTGEKRNPNLPEGQFLKIIRLLSIDDLTVSFNTRTASVGDHSKTGESETFHLNFEVHIALKRRKVGYYCHGYFFDKDVLKGVFIHSFREN